jgi:hypothetical protein
MRRSQTSKNDDQDQSKMKSLDSDGERMFVFVSLKEKYIVPLNEEQTSTYHYRANTSNSEEVLIQNWPKTNTRKSKKMMTHCVVLNKQNVGTVHTKVFLL